MCATVKMQLIQRLATLKFPVTVIKRQFTLRGASLLTEKHTSRRIIIIY